MNSEFLGGRRKGQEEEFFRRQEAALLAQQRARDARRSAREALATASHIKDEALLDQLVALGITPDTLTALSLVPLVVIAWADGTVETAERRAILAAAGEVGLGEGSTGHRLLESCMSERPPADLRMLWAHYIKTLCAALSAEEKEALKAEVLERARSVAEAAGGLVGLGSKISGKEKALLADIARVFDE